MLHKSMILHTFYGYFSPRGFGAEGEPASNINYQVKIESDHPKHEIQDLIDHVDQVAEIHNTLRKGTQVKLI